MVVVPPAVNEPGVHVAQLLAPLAANFVSPLQIGTTPSASNVSAKTSALKPPVAAPWK